MRHALVTITLDQLANLTLDGLATLLINPTSQGFRFRVDGVGYATTASYSASPIQVGRQLEPTRARRYIRGHTMRLIFEDNPVTLFYTIRNSDGTLANAADFASISVRVSNVTTDVRGTAVDVDTSAVSGTLVTNDPRYTPTDDAPGYNAAIDVAGSSFGTADCVYQVEVTFTPTDGESFTEVEQYRAVKTYAD